MFSLLFSNNCDSSRYPVKKSCPYKVVAHCCEICLHSYSLHGCYHYITKVEYPLEECIGMFHHGSNTGYTDIPADTLQRQCMFPYRSIHCIIDTPAFRSKISLVPVTYDSGKTEIYLRIMHIGRCYWKFLDDLYLVYKCMCLVAEVLLIILCCWCTITGSAGICIIAPRLSMLSLKFAMLRFKNQK